MFSNDRLQRVLLILGILCALTYLASVFWSIVQVFFNLLLLLGLAWLVAFILRPIAEWLDRGPVPALAVGLVRRRWGDRPARLLAAVRIPYGLAAVLLYMMTLFGIGLIIVLIVPGIVKQLLELAQQAPEYIQQIPDWWDGVQVKIVERFDVDPETLADVVPIDDLVRQATNRIPRLIDNMITVIQSIATGVANTLLVLILSLYIMLDGRRLSAGMKRVVPNRYQDEMRFVVRTFDRTFGGFLRGQVLMALIEGVFTGILMRLFGLKFTMLTAILSGFLMFIPELGAPVAAAAPSVAAVLQGANVALPLIIIMLIFQQILLRFIIPMVMSEAIGMPPLLILVSVLGSAKLMGLWGFFFGIPLAGAVYTFTVVFLERLKLAADAEDKAREAAEQARKVKGAEVATQG